MRLATDLLLCAIVAVVLVATARCAHATDLEGRLYASPGGVSYHGDRSHRWNERNPGVFLAYVHDETHAVTIGQFKNSFGHQSTVVAYRYTPAHLGPVRLGAAVGLVNGYEHRAGGGFAPVVLPTAVVNAGPIEVSVALFPLSKPGGAVTFAYNFW